MNKAKHCELCENQQYDFTAGTKCSLTDARPSFKDKCGQITFDTKYQKKIKENNIAYEKVLKNKHKALGQFIVYMSITIVLFSVAFYLGFLELSNGIIDKIPFVIAGVGLVTLPRAITPLVSFKQNFKVAKKNKMEMDTILQQYNVRYEIEVLFNTDRHGYTDISTNLNFLRKHYR